MFEREHTSALTEDLPHPEEIKATDKIQEQC